MRAPLSVKCRWNVRIASSSSAHRNRRTGSAACMFRHHQITGVIRSLAWFEDADEEPDPISLVNAAWPDVKASISEAVACLN
jgi:hypothetical protein